MVTSDAAALSAHDVFCLYPTPRGHVAALRGLTLDVAAGERVVVHGPNGAGKTTLLQVLSGMRGPSAGMVSVCGVDLAGASERERTFLRARRLGLVEANHARTLRPEMSVVDNVALQLRITGTARAQARTKAGRLLATLGLGRLAGRSPASLSGGEAQRVAVCAAVAHEPDLILADEPTGELDQAAADAVYDLLADAAAVARAALLLVSHDSRAMRIADRMVRIRDGRLSEEWTPSDSGGEALVIDDRGWVRLPEPLRLRAGIGTRVRAEAGAGALVLSGQDPSPVAAHRGPAREATPAAEGREIAQLSGVTVVRGGRKVLDGQDLCLREGSLTVIQGRSGSGKTTLLRALTGLELPDAGTVRVFGTDLAELDRGGLAALRRRYFAVAAQTTVLSEMLDVGENLELARQARGLDDDPALIGFWVEAFGLAPLRLRPVRVLSGGERQRVAVARVLAVQPALAVLDEPTSRQDEANAERVVAHLVVAARQGVAVVAATHDPVLAEAADTVLTLD
ncbi:MAG TPA: ATP-binding cassette domain-containing protein [Amycolatopsis sp.]|uniref:ATP-binding cassette domain-containing protein n=1 Tax=Amycolatopsis sp. TaxID=37632 RepID=UPI002B46434C|nr:ATP-binding cassette domain-containing protein [Amycolatopsis sp.]HKS49154.1 ATP-binding cassette domain-containing protein [Amycolatopsis sp.]